MRLSKYVLGLILATLLVVITKADQAKNIDNEHNAESEDEEPTKKLAVASALAALGISFIGGHLIVDHWKITVLPEAGFAVLIGVLFSGLFYAGQHKSGIHIDEMIKFDKEFFFLWLLPPIIFEAGYNMKRTAFLENIVPTILYAFIGTFVSTFIIGGIVYGAGEGGLCEQLGLLPSMVFGALISATDPVTVLAVFQSLGVNIDLFSMVFGEAVLNDAVALVMYRSLMQFKSHEFNGASIGAAVVMFLQIFVFSFVIGVALGLLSSLVYKWLDFRHHPNHRFLEASLTVVFPWASYFLAEAFNLSGIVAILFCGMTMAQYTRENLSKEGKSLTSDMYKVVASIAELFVFIYLGMAIFTFQRESSSSLLLLENMRVRLFVVAIIACLISRVFNIVPCSVLVNLFRNSPGSLPKISWTYQFLMWFSGLRGGVAFAIAVANFTDNEFPENDTSLAILQTTLFTAVFTIFVFGGAITRMAIYFKVLTPKDAPPPLETRKSRLSVLDNRLKPFLTHKETPHSRLVEDAAL